MVCTFGGEDGEVVEADVNQVGIASREAGELGVVFKVANEGVLVLVVHVGDDALLRCGIGCLGGLFRHSVEQGELLLKCWEVARSSGLLRLHDEASRRSPLSAVEGLPRQE